MSTKAAAALSLGERRFAGKLSDDYPLWRLARPFLDEVHEAFAKELRGFTKGRSGPLRVLDIGMGMGDGAITEILLQDAKLDVTGIDNEPKMIEQAQGARGPDHKRQPHRRSRRRAALFGRPTATLV